MEKAKKIELLAEILEIDAADITEDKELRELASWDSLTVLTFIATIGEVFNKEISGEQVKNLVTVADALAIME